MIDFDLTIEEMGIMVTAVATLEAIQRRQMGMFVGYDPKHVAYVTATESCLRKLLKHLPEDFTNEVKRVVENDMRSIFKEKGPVTN